MSYLEWTNIFSGVRVRPVTYTLDLNIINGDITIVLSRTITIEWVGVAVDLEFTFNIKVAPKKTLIPRKPYKPNASIP